MFLLDDNALCQLLFLGAVHLKQRYLLRIIESLLLSQLLLSLIGEGIDRPDLPMGMRIRAPHHRAPIFEHLHPLMALAQGLNLRSPQLHYCQCLFLGHVGQRLTVVRVVAEHPATTGNRLRFKQCRWLTRIGGLDFH